MEGRKSATDAFPRTSFPPPIDHTRRGRPGLVALVWGALGTAQLANAAATESWPPMVAAACVLLLAAYSAREWWKRRAPQH